MSELKAFVARKINDGSCDPVPCIEVYPKSEADKVFDHNKYKRCLAMAKWCSSCRFAWSFIPEDDEVHKSNFFKKWELRWLELAEKFKEAK